MGVIGGQSETKSAGLNSASVCLMEQIESTFGEFPFLVLIKDSRGQEFDFGKGAQHWREEPLKIHLKSVKAEKAMVSMSYSCAMFEDPHNFDVEAMTLPGNGKSDAYDSLEKAQWRKYRDAIDFLEARSGETLLNGSTHVYRIYCQAN